MTRTNTALLIALGVVFVWSLIRPHDYFTWFLEVFPAIIGLVILAATWRRFPLTPLLYTLLMIHAAILMIGGHYTYAEVPLGYWMERVFGTARNDYDRVGHFAFHRPLHDRGLVFAERQDDNLAGLQDGAHTHRQRLLRHIFFTEEIACRIAPRHGIERH